MHNVRTILPYYPALYCVQYIPKEAMVSMKLCTSF